MKKPIPYTLRHFKRQLRAYRAHYSHTLCGPPIPCRVSKGTVIRKTTPHASRIYHW